MLKLGRTVKIEVQMSFKPINGYNKAVLTGFEERTTAKGTRTYARFRFVGASDRSFESISITDANNNPNAEICNMIITAAGGKELPVGSDVNVVLGKCIGREFALLAYPQENEKGEVYIHTNFFGSYLDHPAVMPLSEVGKELNLAVQYYTKKKKDNTEQANTIQPPQDEIPF